LYLLSGLGGNARKWVVYGVCTVMDQLIPNEAAQPMIVVMPSGNDNPTGGLGSYWFNHAPPPASDGKRWGDYIWRDVVNFVDSKYRTLPQRTSRAIGGLSAGGQGALTLAFTHPEIFSVVGAHSPSFRRADGSVAAFGDPAYYQPYDPIWLAENTRAWEQLEIWIDDGAADDQWGSAIREYHDLLAALNIPHEWHIFPGTHDPSYWSPLVPTYLQWYSTKLTGQ
jgi:S-formylglutathione hydrolase FrmB